MSSIFDQHYKTLQLEPPVSWPEVKRQYRYLVKLYHPDRYPSSAEGSIPKTRLNPQEAEHRYIETTKAYKKIKEFRQTHHRLPETASKITAKKTFDASTLKGASELETSIEEVSRTVSLKSVRGTRSKHNARFRSRYSLKAMRWQTATSLALALLMLASVASLMVFLDWQEAHRISEVARDSLTIKP